MLMLMLMLHSIPGSDRFGRVVKSEASLSSAR
jgi:hypothetical protein